MNNPSNNKLVKNGSGYLQKVGNQIAITNRLLQDNFDYVKWWNELGDIWKKILLSYIALDVARIKFRHAMVIRKEFEEREDSQEEIDSIKWGEFLERGDVNVDAIKYIVNLKKFENGRLVPKDLEPLRIFFNLEELKINGGEIKSLKPLSALKKLKILDCKDAKMSKEEIENFKKEHPECKVII